MAQVHITEAEAARDFRALLEKVRQGAEVIIEEDARPIAVIKPVPRTGRMISECIALAKAHGSRATLTEDFARDIEEAIKSHKEPWNPPSWD
ncbi:MAG: hypothetical protein HYR60_11465 [Acidobacteria bacterium]|nr:hypothetical protein [Acidobacteriota bacterium]